jgi:hypothetical protein
LGLRLLLDFADAASRSVPDTSECLHGRQCHLVDALPLRQGTGGTIKQKLGRHMTRPAVLSRTFALMLLAVNAAALPISGALADTREAMADAMVRMMEAMGLFDPSAMSSMPLGAPFGTPGMTPGFSGFGMPGPAPWTMPSQDPSGAMTRSREMMKQFSDRMGMPGDMPSGMFPWAPGARLEGVWEGRDGELLIVQGNRFRIYPGHTGYVEGHFQLSGDRLALYNPADDNVRAFELAESEGRLVLRDEAGSLYLYRRLRLEGEQDPAASAPEK